MFIKQRLDRIMIIGNVHHCTCSITSIYAYIFKWQCSQTIMVLANSFRKKKFPPNTEEAPQTHYCHVQWHCYYVHL